MMTMCLHSQATTTYTTCRVIGACHGKPLADDSDAQDKENFEANDPHGLLPQTLEASFERKIQVQEW